MKKSERYNTSYLIEDQFEPGSRGRVLRNLLQIARKREMDVAVHAGATETDGDVFERASFFGSRYMHNTQGMAWRCV